MNDLGYDQLLNPNKSFKLVLVRRGNHREHLLRYFHYLGKEFHLISFLELFSLNIEANDPILTIPSFENFMLNLMYGILEISWLGIPKS